MKIRDGGAEPERRAVFQRRRPGAGPGEPQVQMFSVPVIAGSARVDAAGHGCNLPILVLMVTLPVCTVRVAMEGIEPASLIAGRSSR